MHCLVINAKYQNTFSRGEVPMHKVLFTQTPTFHLVTYWPRLGAVLAAAFLFAVGMIGMAHAECGGTMSYAVCDNVKVVELTPYVDSPVYVRVSGTMTALPCTLIGDGLLLRTHEENARTVYVTLLAAQLLSRDVSIRLSPGETFCTIAYMTLK
jgi:hypothetical protein